MALEKRTRLDRIEIQGGEVYFRLIKEVVDGPIQVASGFHRSVVSAEIDPAEQVAAVNESLATEEVGGYPPISAEDEATIVAYVDLTRSL